MTFLVNIENGKYKLCGIVDYTNSYYS